MISVGPRASGRKYFRGSNLFASLYCCLITSNTQCTQRQLSCIGAARRREARRLKRSVAGSAAPRKIRCFAGFSSFSLSLSLSLSFSFGLRPLPPIHGSEATPRRGSSTTKAFGQGRRSQDRWYPRQEPLRCHRRDGPASRLHGLSGFALVRAGV